MTRFLKRAGLLLLAAVLLAVGWVAGGGRDGAPPDDADLNYQRPSAVAADNAYSFICLATNTLYWPGETRLLLQDIARGHAWDAALVREVLAHNRSTLKNMEEALTCARLQIPDTGAPWPFMPIMDLRQISYLIALNAEDSLQGGDREAAFDAAAANVRLGSMLSRSDSALIGLLVGIAIQELGCSQIRRFIPHASFSRDDWRARLKQLQSIPAPLEGDSLTLPAEYAYARQAYEGIRRRRNGTETVLLLGLPRLLWVVRDYAFHFNDTLAEYGDILRRLQADAGLPLKEETVDDDLSQATPSRLSLILRPNGIGRMLNHLNQESLRNVRARLAYLATSRAATETLLALQASRVSQGTAPDRLERLVPEYLPEVPRDPFDGEPLRYRPAERLLYAVGTNFVDEGGTGREDRWNELDVVFRIVS